jgi:hypothetical protein
VTSKLALFFPFKVGLHESWSPKVIIASGSNSPGRSFLDVTSCSKRQRCEIFKCYSSHTFLSTHIPLLPFAPTIASVLSFFPLRFLRQNSCQNFSSVLHVPSIAVNIMSILRNVANCALLLSSHTTIIILIGPLDSSVVTLTQHSR